MLFQFKTAAIETHHFVHAGDPELFHDRAIVLEHVQRVCAMRRQQGSAEVLRLARGFDVTVPSQTAELAKVGISGEAPPNCSTPTLFLGVRNGADAKTLEGFILKRAPGAQLK